MYEIGKDFEQLMIKKCGGKKLQNNLRASSLGFACDRFHYLALTEYRDPVQPTLQSIFEEGNLHERDVESKLREMGYEVEGNQREFRLDKPLITMHIDGMIRKDGGAWCAYDAKSIASWSFDGINSAEDFIYSKKPHERNYPAQILLYMLATNAEHGCLILKNKQTGWLKDIWFDFDTHIGILDDVIKRAERIYAARDTKTPPERTQDRSLCDRCDFNSICMPDLLANGGISFLDSEDLATKLERRNELKELFDEYNDLDEEVKDTIKKTGVGEKAVGNFLAKVSEVHTTRKKPITWDEEKTSYLKVNITKLMK